MRAEDVQRIVSTAPSITETLFAMGLGARVVGVTIYCKFPRAVLALPKIGTYLKPDLEAIVALHPDLVVVQRQSNHLSEELGRVHIRCIDVESDNLEAVFEGAREIGRAVGDSGAAERFIRDTKSQLARLQERTRTLPAPSVAFIVGHNPGSLDGLFAGGGKSYFSDLLQYAGATNIFSDAATPYPEITLEALVVRNPEAIIELSGDTASKQSDVAALWRKWPSLRAVKASRIYAVPSDPFVVPGPRVVEAAALLAHLLHPELKF